MILFTLLKFVRCILQGLLRARARARARARICSSFPNSKSEMINICGHGHGHGQGHVIGPDILLMMILCLSRDLDNDKKTMCDRALPNLKFQLLDANW